MTKAMFQLYSTNKTRRTAVAFVVIIAILALSVEGAYSYWLWDHASSDNPKGSITDEDSTPGEEGGRRGDFGLTGRMMLFVICSHEKGIFPFSCDSD